MTPERNPNPVAARVPAMRPANTAPRLRSRWAGRSTNTILLPCSSHTSYFSEIRSICWRSRKTSRSKARSALGRGPEEAVASERQRGWGAGHSGGCGGAVLSSALGTFDEPAGEFVLQLVRCPTLALDADGHVQLLGDGEGAVQSTA